MIKLCAVVAAATNDVIGRDNELPWHVPADLRRFRQLTTGHCLVAGRLTHESIMSRLGGPLPDRLTFVASHSVSQRETREDGTRWAPNVNDTARWALESAHALGHSHVFVIGGASVYAQLLPRIDRFELTRIFMNVRAGDAYLPIDWSQGFVRTSMAYAVGDNDTEVRFETYERVPSGTVLPR